jgi:hypothetical protein
MKYVGEKPKRKNYLRFEKVRILYVSRTCSYERASKIVDGVARVIAPRQLGVIERRKVVDFVLGEIVPE